jgi:DNA-binding NtrC family response regulator
MQLLQEYDWPGNVRELRNLIERSLIVGSLNVSALHHGLERRPAPAAPAAAAAPPPAPLRGPLHGPLDLETIERHHIVAVLESVGGDKTRAAQLLGISRRTLERRFADGSLHGG